MTAIKKHALDPRVGHDSKPDQKEKVVITLHGTYKQCLHIH